MAERRKLCYGLQCQSVLRVRKLQEYFLPLLTFILAAPGMQCAVMLYHHSFANKGAVISLTDQLEMEIQQFVVEEFPAIKAVAHAANGAQSAPSSSGTAPTGSRAQRLAQQQLRVLHILRELICEAKMELQWYFEQAAGPSAGLVTRLQWANGMRTVLQLPQIPWLTVLPDLVTVEKNGLIDYKRFLNR